MIAFLKSQGVRRVGMESTGAYHFEVADDLSRAVEVLDVREAEVARASVKRACIEIALETLPAGRDPCRHLVVEITHARFFNGVVRVGVIENDLRAAREAGKLAEPAEDHFLCQIGGDPEPRHEGRTAGVETARLERRRHAAALEVMRHEADMPRLGEPGANEAAASVALRRRMIQFENSDALRAFEPVGERVEPRAENEDLP